MQSPQSGWLRSSWPRESASGIIYLVDPDRRCVYRGFRILWLDRVRLLFQQQDIFGIATEGNRFSTKYGTYWAYRVVLLSVSGSQEPLGNWRREWLKEYNEEAAKLAKMLGCPAHLTSAQSTLRFEMQGQNPVVSFGPYKSGLNRIKMVRLIAVAFALLLYLLVLSLVVAKRR